MIASSTLHALSFHLAFVLHFLWDKLILLIFTTQFSSSQLYSFLQTTLLPLSLPSIILFLCLELSADKVHVEEFLHLFGLVIEDVFVVGHCLVKARCDTIQDDDNKMVVHHLGIDIDSIDMIQVFLDSASLFEITYLVKSPA